MVTVFGILLVVFLFSNRNEGRLSIERSKVLRAFFPYMIILHHVSQMMDGIGDNVYIGPNVSIIEDVIIGNNVTIGAGSVIIKNIPDNATVVGNPQRVTSYDSPGRFIGNRWNS